MKPKKQHFHMKMMHKVKIQTTIIVFQNT